MKNLDMYPTKATSVIPGNVCYTVFSEVSAQKAETSKDKLHRIQKAIKQYINMLKILKAMCSITPNHATSIFAKFPSNTFLLSKSQLLLWLCKSQEILKLIDLPSFIKVSLAAICYWNTSIASKVIWRWITRQFWDAFRAHDNTIARSSHNGVNQKFCGSHM